MPLKVRGKDEWRRCRACGEYAYRGRGRCLNWHCTVGDRRRARKCQACETGYYLGKGRCTNPACYRFPIVELAEGGREGEVNTRSLDTLSGGQGTQRGRRSEDGSLSEGRRLIGHACPVKQLERIADGDGARGMYGGASRAWNAGSTENEGEAPNAEDPRGAKDPQGDGTADFEVIPEHFLMAKPADSSSSHSAGRVLADSGLVDPAFWEPFNHRNVNRSSNA